MAIFINKRIFRHLKLEIALAIPALKEWKIETSTLAGQGLKSEKLLAPGLNMLCR